jgi:hypothetical protein
MDPARHRGQVSATLLLEQQREEVGLEEQVSELVLELGRVVAERGIRDLVRLLDGVRNDRPRRLFAVPRAVAPEALGQLLQLEKSVGELCAVGAQPVVALSVAVGLNPTWYAVSSSRSFLMSATHFSIFLFFCS